MKKTLECLLNKQNLTSAQMIDAMRFIMSGNANETQIAAFLIALRCKGETVDEITAAAIVMRELAKKIIIENKHLIDTCGTGGDGANTFNISTTSAFVVAAAGGKVAKHGNRSVSSQCGSADVLEAAGVNLNLTSQQVIDCVEKIGVGFLFAPNHHEAMRYVASVRKSLGVRTLFNLLGPLVNPANASNQLMGVFSQQWLEPLAHVFKKLGSQHVLIVCAEDGLDEISIATPSHIAELKNNEITRYTITPEQFGLPRADLSEITISNKEDSLNFMLSVLKNQNSAAKNIVLLNAGAAIYAANLTDSLSQGIEKAKEVIEKGLALEKFNALIHYS